MKTGERLRALLASGDLYRLARQCRTRADLAAAIGVSDKAYRKARGRIAGFPTFEELRARGGDPPDLDRTLWLQRDHAEHNGTGEIIDVHGTRWSVQPDITKGDNEFSAEEPTQPGLTAEDVRHHAAATSRSGVPVPVMPPGHVLRGASTLVAPDGSVVQQWVKTTAKNDERQDWLDAIRAIAVDLPRIDPVPAPSALTSDLLSVYPVGDPHIGMLAWERDAGENFDLHIAESNLVGAFTHLVNLAPASDEALIIFIGDTLHSDGQNNTTTKGTRVDVDGRTAKMMATAIRICRRAVACALAKHGRVTLILERGNHDELLSLMLALALDQFYENEPRVTVDTSPEMFHWYEFGANLIGTHHGHNVKPADLLGVMAVDQAHRWGRCRHRRFYRGHYHHQQTQEVPGLIVETLPTLAGSDAWHRGMGYRHMRAMYMDVLHRERGHENRHIVGIEQVRESVAS